MYTIHRVMYTVIPYSLVQPFRTVMYTIIPYSLVQSFRTVIYTVSPSSHVHNHLLIILAYKDTGWFLLSSEAFKVPKILGNNYLIYSYFSPLTLYLLVPNTFKLTYHVPFWYLITLGFP